MGYLHINNLYKDQAIMMFQECYALEKIHGTSAHISYNPETLELRYFSGGESHERFVALFDGAKLREAFNLLALPADKTITVYGEAYGGSQQKMSATYGNQLKFIAFDVCIGDAWLSVPDAEQIVKSLGLEFVHYTKVKLTKAVKRETGDDMWDVVPSFDELDAHRDAPSIQAVRNGIVEPKPREGIVCRPLKEVTLNNGHRLIVKHKGDAFKETATPREASIDPARLAVLADADAVASEWVTPMRLAHVLDKIPEHGMEKMREIITAMVEDVMREGAGEIVDSREVRKAISTRTTTLYKQSLMERKHE